MIAAMMDAYPSQEWDIEWTYKNGLFADNGFDVITNKIASETLLENAVQLYSESGTYIRITVPEYQTCRKCIAEAEFSITEMNTTANGFRFMLSNGTYGCQIVVNKSASNVVLRYNNGSTAGNNKIIRNINIGKTYKLKIDFDESIGNKIYLNEQLILETDVFSTYYCNGNRFFSQESCKINMYSVRYKFLEV